MKVTYRVISSITGNDLTDKESWVLQPNGRLAYNRYGDLVGDSGAEVVFTIEGVEEPKESKWIPASEKLGVNIGMKCALCKARISYSEFFNGNHNYCYRCGAKMIKEEKDKL